MKTAGIFAFKGSSLITLCATSVLSALGFCWPFIVTEKQGHPQWIFLLAAPCALLTLLANISNKLFDAKTIALLAVLSALVAALRPMGTGAVGIEPMWFILILAARVFGPSFGFLLGTISMFLSAILTGGLGPWVAYQSFAAGWIGLGVALIPRSLKGRAEIFALSIYGIIAAEFFGIAMDLQFWPWAVGSDSQLSYRAGALLSLNISHFISYHFLSSMAWDIPRAIFTAVSIVITGRPILHTLRRAHTRAAFLTPIEFIEREKVQKEAQ
jgi:energy-coupling factor transport system substrate-specific component